MDILYKPPKILKLFFPDIIWKSENEGILLTIDDGPSENTFKILDILDKHKFKAVFFCTGVNIEKHFNEFSAIIKSGHSVENHGYNHNKLILKDKKYNLNEIERTNDLIRSFTGVKPSYFRPPYGLFNFNTINAVKDNGMRMMMWSLLSGDHTGDFTQVKRLCNTYLDKKSVLVMHDNKKSIEIFRQSLEFIAGILKDKSFKLNDIY